MKDSKIYTKKTAAFIKKYVKKTQLSLPESNDKTDILIYAGLYEHLDSSQVGGFWKVMQNHFVDWNDLRVSRPEEVLDVVLGIDVASDVKKKITQQLIAALNGIFTKYDRITLEELEELGKRDANQDLESISELTPFMIDFVMLVLKGSHSLPVNEKIAEYARQTSLVHPNAELEDIQSFLERQIGVDDTANFYLALREQAENFEPPSQPIKKTTKKAKRAVKKTVAKSEPVKKAASKKMAAKKTTAKKTATKKASAKKSTPKKTAPKKTTAKKASPKKKAAVKKTAAKKTAKKKTAAKKTTSKKTAAKKK